MARPERVLRLSGRYQRNQEKSEEEFHDFLSHRHGVECAKIHEKHGILKYQMVHDMEIEYYFKDAQALLDVSGDEGFKALHIECEPYVNLARTTVTLTWVEVYLEDGRLVNVDAAGKSMQPSFAELNDIEEARPVAKYY
ncbi:hypothetical protein PG996_003347 [Apiospora saccharicola]|uniref:EthD domain-containing protein n=1 Tax=Apiospora saccharicola TaxID=335842 RepID=A0ABR1W108_9PEZI